MRASDYIVDIGPGAGVHGGQVFACRNTRRSYELIKILLQDNIYLVNRKIEVPQKRRKGNGYIY